MSGTKRLSKFLSLVLRHKAGDFGLELDAAGYADLQAVWSVIASQFRGHVTQDDFDALMVESNRFEIRAGKIRARYGHSDVGEVRYPPATSPEYLYHGTVEAALVSIRVEGLTAQARQYVHLSTTVERTAQVATRRGTPVVLTIHALDAHRGGISFHLPNHSISWQKPSRPRTSTFRKQHIESWKSHPG
jgi:putative RNA 2'-phosphotransferase